MFRLNLSQFTTVSDLKRILCEKRGLNPKTDFQGTLTALINEKLTFICPNNQTLISFGLLNGHIIKYKSQN